MSRQGRKVGLVIAAVALAACALLLWMIVRSGGSDDSGGGASAESSQPGATGDGARTASSGDGANGPRLPQLNPGEGGRRRTSADPNVTETIVNGVRVRDHRRDRSKPIVLHDPPPSTRSRRIDAKVTADVNDQLLPGVRECGAAVPPEARSAKPRVQGQVTLAIKDHRLSITAATIEITGVAGATLEIAKKCVQEKALAVTVPQVDEEDLESYPLQISYTLP
jgi:hypothetical protein